MDNKRKGIGAKMRFEVFKRDQFKCVYCGAAAPNVVLHADHVKPVSKGGKNTILNLVTACSNCNSGKSNIELSDNTAVSKQLKQAQELQERREQLEMMAKWIDSLDNIQNDAISILEKHWFKERPNICWNKSGKDDITKLLKKFTLIEISQAMDICKQQYIKDYSNSEQTGLAFNKIGAVLYTSKKTAEDPNLKAAYYCRGILKNRIALYKPDHEILSWLKEMIYYWNAEEVIEICKSVKNWTQFRDAYETMFEETF